MSTQASSPRPSLVSPLPRLALVQRLDRPSVGRSPVWVRILARLCLYSIPGACGLLFRLNFAVFNVDAAASAAHAHFILLFSFCWLAALECFRASGLDGINREHTGATAVLKSTCVAMAAALILLHLPGLPGPAFARCAAFAAAVLLASISIKLLLRRLCDARRRLPRILVAVASMRNGRRSWKVVQKEVSRHRISGAIHLQQIGAMHLLTARLSTAELAQELRCRRVEGVLISASAADAAELSRQIESCGGLGATASFIVGPQEGFYARDEVSTAESIYLFNTGAAPAETVHYRFFKRAFDIVFALAVLIAGLPFMLTIAAAVWMTSKGPVLFIQDRVGWNGRVFRMYKFRTMRNAPAAESDTRWTMPGDSRRTWVGRFLRRYSLDELPQFFNVLKGEMSVVGPRPERPHFVSSFRRQIAEYQRRHQLKVGITGWAQVNGLRGETCIRTRLMYDLYYLQNWGLMFDLRIVLRTAFCIFRGINAY